MTLKLSQAGEQHAAELQALRLSMQHAQKSAQQVDDALRQLQRVQVILSQLGHLLARPNFFQLDLT